ncbi:MAG: hypothetical protein ACE5E0_02800 [Terriglobia bacterium]
MPDLARDLRAAADLVTSELDSIEVLAREALPDLVLAELTLAGGLFGDYDTDRLVRAAAAVELLNFGVSRHYYGGQPGPDGNGPQGTDLIMGDYYYARAIILVLPLGCEVVGIGAGAIASVAEGEISTGVSRLSAEAIRKQAALYAAAFDVASCISCVESEVRARLCVIGEAVGALAAVGRQAERTDRLVDRFSQQLVEGIASLPSGEARDNLKRVGEHQGGLS